MSLSRTITAHIVGLLLGLVCLAGVSLWGLAGIRDNAELAKREYDELQTIQSAVYHAAMARVGVDSGQQDDAVQAELEARDERLNEILEAPDEPASADQLFNRKAVAESISGLREALEELHASRQNSDIGGYAYEHVLSHINELADQMGSMIAASQTAADERLRSTTWAIAIISVLILLSVTWIQLSHYRSLVLPLRNLHQGVQRMAERQFRDRLPIEGPEEFQSLAREFNQMAQQLETLYGSLEEKVKIKSRELVRSERLASVGFLAAGVAHEINNPLNIISAYAELLLNRLDTDFPSPDQLAANLNVICEEAFRCKGITEKLLSLAMRGENSRGPVSLASLAREVADMAAHLKQFQGRRIKVQMPSDNDLRVVANANELKQVLLNLVVNALQAVDPGKGEVVLRGDCVNGRVAMHVEDNGKGMAREVLDHVFEPFFTERRSSGGHGLGLGLSISHAIVESHGGKLSACSAGPNQGSCFTMEIPSYEGNERHE